jgi:hypothetical protein
MKKVKIIMAEMLLLLSSVFVFRGLWAILDSIPLMNKPIMLWLSLFVGVIGTVYGLSYIIKHGKD